MSILRCSSLKREPEPLPIFVLRTKGEDSMEFYGFHDFFCRTFDGDDEVPCSDKIRAIPFTRLNSCPGYCGFTSYRGDIIIVGGTLFSLHLRKRLHLQRDNLIMGKFHDISYEQILEIINEHCPSAMLPSRVSYENIGSYEFIHSNSNRFATFSVQDLVNNKQSDITFTLGSPTDLPTDLPIDTKGWPIDVCDLGFPIDSYWHSKSSLVEDRASCHLHVVHGKLFAVGGNREDITELSIEVYDNDGWRPAVISPPVHDLLFISVALPDGILIGSFESGHFTYLQLKPNFFDFISISLPHVDCPDELMGAMMQTEILVGEDIVVWFNHNSGSELIRGLQLGTHDETQGSKLIRRGLQLGSHRYKIQHFFIDIIGDNILIPDHVDPEYCTNTYHAKLIGLGKGRIAMIYTGTEHRTEVDEEGIQHYLCDYRCVTFEIIYDHSFSYQVVPYPGIQLKTRIISNRKCYAPYHMDIETALVTDVCFPVENLSLTSSRERLGLQAILH